MSAIRDGCRAVGTVVMLVLAGPTSGASPEPKPPRRILVLPLTFDQVMAAGAAGTGCSWSREGRRGVLFAAAGDRAVVRLRTGVVVLTPAPDATGLFPTTFDRWTGGGMAVKVHPGGGTTIRGESIVQRATLTIASGGSTRRLDGRLDCGS